MDAAVARYARVDIVVNNAALSRQPAARGADAGGSGPAGQPADARGTKFLATQVALPHLRAGGRIVNIVSVLARASPPLQTISRRHQGHGGLVPRASGRRSCRPSMVAPSTPCRRGRRRTPEGFMAAGEDMMKVLGPMHCRGRPLEKRLGSPDEIAYAVAFLCEERARWINGEHSCANGGLSID